MTAPALEALTLTADEAQALTARIRSRLAAVTADLIEAWCARVWVPLGYPTWDAWLDAEFGDLLSIRLPVAVRRERVVELRLAGMSTRAIAPALGVKKSTIAADLRRPEVAERVKLAEVISLDSYRRPATAPEPTTTRAPAPSSVDRVVAAVARAGDEGLTVHEAARRLHWRQGQSSCALSRAEKRRRLVRSGRFRDGCAVYVIH